MPVMAMVSLNGLNIPIMSTPRMCTNPLHQQNHKVSYEELVHSPNNNDVLLGRGGKNSRHPGNEQLRSFCSNAAIEYSRSCKHEKSQLSRDLVIRVRQLNPAGRFLKKDQKAWMDVGDIAAREKTRQVLRDAVNILELDCGGVSQRPIRPEVTSSSSQRSKVRPRKRSEDKAPLPSKPNALPNLLVGLEGHHRGSKVMQRRGNVIVKAIKTSSVPAQEPFLVRKDTSSIVPLTAREKTRQVLRDAVNVLKQHCECVSQRPIPPEAKSSSSQRSKVRPRKRSENKLLLPSKPSSLQNLLASLEGHHRHSKVMQRRGNVIVKAIKTSSIAAQEPFLVRKDTSSIVPFTDRKRTMVVDGDRVFQHAYPWVCSDAPLSSDGANPLTRDRRHSLSSRTNDAPCGAHTPSTPWRRESINNLRLDWPEWLPSGSFDDVSEWGSDIQ